MFLLRCCFKFERIDFYRLPFYWHWVGFFPSVKQKGYNELENDSIDIVRSRKWAKCSLFESCPRKKQKEEHSGG